MMINGTDVFQILEIEQTEDRRAIKKAYARLVKKYHPEEQPEKWKEIHDAYETALHMAEHGLPAHEPYTASEPPVLNGEGGPEPKGLPDASEAIMRKPADVPTDKPWDDQREQEEMAALFKRVNDIASGQLEQSLRQKKEAQDEKVSQIIKITTDLLEKEIFSQETWSILLEQDSILPLLCSNEFLYAFGDCFQGKRIPADFCRYLREQIVRIQNYDTRRRMEARASLWEEWDSREAAIGYAARKIDTAHYANIGKQVEEQKKRSRKSDVLILPKVLMGLMALIMFLCGIVLLFEG